MDAAAQAAVALKAWTLSLPVGDEGAREDILLNTAFTVDDVTLLKRFVGLNVRVRQTDWLKRGISGVSNLTIDKKGMSITSDSPTDGELHSLLHVLRLVTLEKEAASFQKVTAVVVERIDNARVREYLAINHHVFMHGEMSLYMQITIGGAVVHNDKGEEVVVGGQKLFDESLLRLWLNGTQYHSDAKKAETWATLEKSLSEPNSRAIVVAQLHDKVMALLNLDSLVRQVIEAYEGPLPAL